MAEAIQAFARRARASFAGPSHSQPSQQQENAHLVPRKRSQSLGGPLAEMQLARTNSRDEADDSLSPRKKARRSLVPGRSILRKSLGPTAVLAFGDEPTITLTAANLSRHDSTETLDGGTDHRKSLARRVSFAPAAHLREFTKDEPEDVSLEQISSPPVAAPPPPPPPAPSAAPSQPSPRRQSVVHRRQSSITRFEDAEEMSMEMADASITAAFDVPGYGYSASAALLDEEEPDYGDESEMSLAGNDVTSAFAANTVIMAQQQQQVAPASEESMSSEESVANSLIAQHIEYQVPLHPPGVAPPSLDSELERAAAAEALEDEEEAPYATSEDEDATMEMELDVGTTGLVVEDGFTSRRLSVSGAVRRASMAPGQAALAMLDAMEEEEEGGSEEDQEEQTPQPTPVKPLPPSRIPLSSGNRGRPPSSLAAPSPEAFKRRQTMGSPSPVKATIRPKSPATSRPSRPDEPDVFAATSPMRETIEEEDGEGPLSLEDFLERANVQFMEDMFPSKRKSLGAADPTMTTALKTKATLAEQVVAAGALIPSLEMYRAMAHEMRASMAENGRFLETCSAIVDQRQPEVFADFLSANEAEREMMEAQFKLIKNYFRLEVRNEWYEYRCGVYGNGEGSVNDALRRNLQHLEQDRVVVREAGAQLAELVPALRQREAELTRDVETERARQEELEGCDQEHLMSLREAVAEQAAQLEEQQREQTEVEQELARLEAKLGELDHRKSSATTAIDRAKSASEGVQCYTKTEVYRLKAELEAAQELHGWKLVAFNSDELKLVHRGAFGVIIALTSAGIKSVEFDQLPLSDLPSFDGFPRLVLDFCLKRIVAVAVTTALPVDAVLFLRLLASRWTAALRLANEVAVLQRRFPVSISTLTKKSREVSTSLRLSARVHSEKAKAAFAVQFEVTGEEVLAGDADVVVSALGCAVEVKFGDINSQELQYLVRETLDERQGRGVLLAAVCAAESKYL